MRQPARTHEDPPDDSTGSGEARRTAMWHGLALALGCGFVYLLIAGSFQFRFEQTPQAYQMLLADALLHGQFYIRPEALAWKRAQIAEQIRRQLNESAQPREQPLDHAEQAAFVDVLTGVTATADLGHVNGKFYGYWGPLTPVLMVPLVAIWGVGVNNQVIHVLFAAANVGLFYWLLRRVDRLGLCPTDEACRIALTLLLAFGTAHFWMACAADIWFAVQIVTLTMLLAALLAACRARPTLWAWAASGAFFGASLLARNFVVLVGLFFPVLLWIRSASAETRRGRWILGRALAFGLPVLIAVGLQGAYNYARFGDIRDTGFRLMTDTGGHPRFRANIERYGAFSLHYLPYNLRYYFWHWGFPRLEDGRIGIDREGVSMFLVMPVLVYLFVVHRWRHRFPLALLAGFVPLLVADLLFCGSGVPQFGPRYLLEAMPFILMLVAIGMRGRVSHLSYFLIVLGIAIHLFGTYRFCWVEFAPIEARITNLTLPALVCVALLARLLVVRVRAT